YPGRTGDERAAASFQSSSQKAVDLLDTAVDVLRLEGARTSRGYERRKHLQAAATNDKIVKTFLDRSSSQLRNSQSPSARSILTNCLLESDDALCDALKVCITLGN